MGLLFNFNRGINAQDNPVNSDRKPSAAGRFYPANAHELRNTLASLFTQAKPRNLDHVNGIICPHAGYVFSGIVAASGYNQLDTSMDYENVFVIASSHQVVFPGASIYNQGDYVTPLGKVSVNIGLANELIRNNPDFTFNPEADLTEHSLEVQVPFLQYHLKKEFKLVPIVIGAQSAEICKSIAKALQPYFNDRNLFIFSTDFSHYPSYNDATHTDKATCDAIVTGSPEKLMNFLREYHGKGIPNLSTSLCGWTSILVMLELTTLATGITITPVQYMNSGDSKYGDKSQVVGYWSLALTRQPQDFILTPDERRKLLNTARQAIETFLEGGQVPLYESIVYDKNLQQRAGAFVTLREAGNLRGCIGRFISDIPLYKLICEMAIAAATQDSRFDPVSLREIRRLDIEISVLTPLKRITSPAEIIPGKHGIYIRKGHSSGTYLPQVATETGWTVEEFLGHCARDKAGLGWNGWKDAEVFVYEACVFSEQELTGRKD